MEKKQANQAIREEIRKAGLKQYEVAEALSISEFTLVRWLRHELDETRKQAVCAAVQHLKGETA